MGEDGGAPPRPNIHTNSKYCDEHMFLIREKTPLVYILRKSNLLITVFQRGTHAIDEIVLCFETPIHN